MRIEPLIARLNVETLIGLGYRQVLVVSFTKDLSSHRMT